MATNRADHCSYVALGRRGTSRLRLGTACQSSKSLSKARSRRMPTVRINLAACALCNAAEVAVVGLGPEPKDAVARYRRPVTHSDCSSSRRPRETPVARATRRARCRRPGPGRPHGLVAIARLDGVKRRHRGVEIGRRAERWVDEPRPARETAERTERRRDDGSVSRLPHAQHPAGTDRQNASD